MDKLGGDLQEYSATTRELEASVASEATPNRSDLENGATGPEALPKTNDGQAGSCDVTSSVTNLEVKAIQKVQELPLEPTPNAHYVFDGLAREEVTRFNHGLHKYPAKFIPQLPRWAIEYGRLAPGGVVLDPFCGSGTSLVEAGMRGYSAIGYDINPLATLLARAKTAILHNFTHEPKVVVEEVVCEAINSAPSIFDALVSGSYEEDLHHTWTFWFRPLETARLLALRDVIVRRFTNSDPQLATILLACLSSVAKASSFLDEDQIKVKKIQDKKLADPFATFPRCAVSTLEKQLRVGQLFREAGAEFEVSHGSATHLSLRDSSVDCVITSPPYINAVDYTMTHKYNLFLLGLIRPESFKSHCREYIGMTERAVRAADLTQIPCTGIERVDERITTIWDINTPVSRNRAFVVAQYFSGMLAALKEIRRVLRPAGKATLVVGNTNRICGQEVPTAPLVEYLANKIGLTTELKFHHHVANRSSMRLNRNDSGGKLKHENVYVFCRS